MAFMEWFSSSWVFGAILVLLIVYAIAVLVTGLLAVLIAGIFKLVTYPWRRRHPL